MMMNAEEEKDEERKKKEDGRKLLWKRECNENLTVFSQWQCIIGFAAGFI